MDRLDTLRVFVAVAEAGGFAAAARRLGLSPAAATRAVAALEARLGARLLHRTTRHVRLSEAGGRFLTDARRILGELAEAEASAAGAHAAPSGRLAVTAPVLLGQRHVMPVVSDFLARYREVSVRAILLDRVADLIDEGFDVAVRIAHLPDSSLTAIRVGAMRRIVCAAPSYLAARGVPAAPADLAGHEAITFAPGETARDWLFQTGERRIAVAPPARLVVNTAGAAVEAAVRGHGLTRLLHYQAAPQIADGTLAVVLADFEPPPLPVHVVHIEGRRAAARVRGFVDFAVERLRADPVLAGGPPTAG